MAGDVGQVLSADEMLARAAKNVASGNTHKPQSAVEKLLAERDTPLEDTVDISPVQRLLREREAKEKAKETPYTEQDWFLKLKVNQLRAQLATYSAIPGLDPNGAIMDGIAAEIKDIVQKQQATLQESLQKADDAKAKLAEQDKLKAQALPSADDLLARVQGTEPEPEISKEAQALLDNLSKGVDTTA